MPYEKELLEAAKTGNLNEVKLALEAEANINVKNQNGQSAIHLAANGGHKEIIQLLIDKTANLQEIDDFGMTPLEYAIYNEALEIVRLFVKVGVYHQEIMLNQLYSLNAAHEIARARNKIKTNKSNAANNNQAKTQFDNKEGLEDAINQEILPALVSLTTSHGSRRGTGFFYHPNWLVSNAHVVPSREVLDEQPKIRICNQPDESEDLILQTEISYHRPDNNQSPDIVIIKTANQPQENNKSLSRWMLSLDSTYNGNYLFYVDLNLNNYESYQIKHLKLVSTEGYPLIYKCEDGSEPQPGCSGSPIIQAQLVTTHINKRWWQFKVVGILYARCSSTFETVDQTLIQQMKNPDAKLMCSIPIEQDFLQILSILHEQENTVRAQLLANAASNMGDEQGKKDATTHLLNEAKSKQITESKLKLFEEGSSSLDIALPNGLEKLWYEGIVKLTESLLIESVLKQQTKQNSKNFNGIKTVSSVSDLHGDFNALIKEISEVTATDLKFRKEDALFETKYFRLDVTPVAKGKFWMLQIQDNTGLDSNGNPLKYQGKSLSSVFAIVKILQSLSLSGQQISEYLQHSYNQSLEISVSEVNNSKQTNLSDKQSWEQKQQEDAAFESFLEKIGYIEINLSNDLFIASDNYKLKLTLHDDENNEHIWILEICTNQDSNPRYFAGIEISKEIESIPGSELLELFMESKNQGQNIQHIPNNTPVHSM